MAAGAPPYASEELKKDPEIVLSAVEAIWLCTEYASKELKKDPEFVPSAVKQHGWALQYAPRR